MKSLFWFILGFVIASAGLGIADRMLPYMPSGEPWEVWPATRTTIDPGFDVSGGKSCTCPPWITDGKGFTPNVAMEKKEKTVDWATKHGQPWTVIYDGHKTMEIGFRDDGIVVWRKSESK